MKLIRKVRVVFIMALCMLLLNGVIAKVQKVSAKTDENIIVNKKGTIEMSSHKYEFTLDKKTSVTIIATAKMSEEAYKRLCEVEGYDSLAYIMSNEDEDFDIYTEADVYYSLYLELYKNQTKSKLDYEPDYEWRARNR